jgi:DNA-binding beta-propeller fold protein YncE
MEKRMREWSVRVGVGMSGWIALMLLTGCGTDDALGPGETDHVEVGVVLNSLDISLTVIDPENLEASRTIGLAPDGSPVGFSVRGNVVVVPLGVAPAVVVVDLFEEAVRHTVALPEGSGATGSAFLNDSIVLVANPDLDSLTPVNVRSGLAAQEVPVGRYPQHVVVLAGRVFVLNAELGPDFLPARSGTVTVLDGQTLDVLGTVELSGLNPGDAVPGPDGRLYVINSGNFAAGNGSLSIIDPVSMVEVDHIEGFGDFPFGATLGPDGNLYVTSFSFGIAIWSPVSGGFVRGPQNAVTPEDVPSVPAVSFDAGGRLYSLRPDCQAPSAALRLDDSFAVEAVLPVGICPIQIAFTDVGG